MRYKTIIILLMITLFFSCNKEEHKLPDNFNSIPQHQIEVVDKSDAGSYTYIQAKEENFIYWIAVPKIEVQKGEKLFFSKSMEMKNFKSETLNKTFESILFVEDIRKEEQQQAVVSQHSQVNSAQKEKINLEPLKDGKTIKQIFEQKDALNGKIVKVRGKVVKFNSGILNTNWIHIQDGTNFENDFDLVVTSDIDTQVGKIIVVEGTVSVNKNLGSGYTYKVLIENAQIKAE